MTYVLSRKAPTFVIFVMLALPALVHAQSAPMVSADKFFAELSASYGKVKDYEAAFTWTQGKSVSNGRVSYKSPVYLRLDFTSPANQVLNFDGEKLTFYSPANEIILEQKYKKRSSGQMEGMVTSQGLTLWQRNYSIAYLTGSSEIPLDEGSSERVVKLKLVSRAATSYSQMILSVERSSADKSTPLIRRVEGLLTGGEKVVLDFTNIRTNQGVPDSRFVYDGPAGASIVPDWLFDPEQ
jgi:outer membrane lipoprotein carrier protein